MAEDERAGYKVAVDLWTTASNQNWSRFNAMLVANAVIVGATVQVLTKEPRPSWAVLLPIAGLVVCVLWGFAVTRGLAYQNYYVSVARRLEEQLPTVSVVRAGHNLPMRWRESLKAEGVMYSVIVLFAMLYLGSIALLWSWRPHMTASLVGPMWLTIAYLVGAAGAFISSRVPTQVHGISMFSLEGVTGNATPANPTWFRIGMWGVAASFALQIVWVWLEWWMHH